MVELYKLAEDMCVSDARIELSKGSIKGDNYLGVIHQAVVEGKKNGRKIVLNWIVKSASQKEEFRAMICVESVYKREAYAYQEVIPTMMMLQKDRNVPDPFESVTQVYKVILDPCKELLVMENMKKLGYILRDRKIPLNFEHTALVLREYAKWHALSYALRDQKPELFDKLARNCKETFFLEVDAEQMQISMERHCDRALEAFDATKDKHIIEKFSAFKTKIIDSLKEILIPEAAGEYAVLVHGDSWVNNMLFKYSVSRKKKTTNHKIKNNFVLQDATRSEIPTNVCILDWQLLKIGSPVLDLSYFIFTCTEKSLRDHHYDELIELYFNTLRNQIKSLGSDPDTLFPRHILQEHLKKFSLYGLTMTVMVVYLMMSETEELPDWSEIKSFSEMKTAFDFDSKNIYLYHDRIKGVITDFVNKNYL